ncbi:helix-turn-helix domain-containing protein [Natrononativus amylolyticus]|uniref:helix-turn-helix domain-containing protein n=1 Tax=Natrononativus amylolyticus TaxID=2963434 RepID=UPI0020CF86B3|nr:helix-turn-helix domain-containing protein [Natrononativus amylolyticus]
MIRLTLTIRQDDCPLSEASAAHEIAFVTPHWYYHHDKSRLELRVLAAGENRKAVTAGLDIVQSHQETESFELLALQRSNARARLTLKTTQAMGTVISHDGYLTGPFRNVDGTEQWEIGFDDAASAESALDDLHADNTLTEYERTQLDLATVFEGVRATEVGTAVIEACRTLTPTERKTVRHAIEAGYYDVPRSATLEDLATAFDVSSAATSKTIRRAETKLLSPVGSVLDSEPIEEENRSLKGHVNR